MTPDLEGGLERREVLHLRRVFDVDPALQGRFQSRRLPFGPCIVLTHPYGKAWTCSRSTTHAGLHSSRDRPTGRPFTTPPGRGFWPAATGWTGGSSPRSTERATSSRAPRCWRLRASRARRVGSCRSRSRTRSHRSCSRERSSGSPKRSRASGANEGWRGSSCAAASRAPPPWTPQRSSTRST